MKFLAEERSHYQRETKSLLLKKDHTEEQSQSEDNNKNNGYKRNKIQLWALVGVPHQQYQQEMSLPGKNNKLLGQDVLNCTEL